MNAVLIVFLKECRESLRDRRVLINALLLGPLLGPLLFVILLRLTIARELAQADRALPVAIVGAERAPNLIAALRAQGLEPLPAEADVEAAVRAQRLDLALRITDSYAADWQAGRPAQVELVEMTVGHPQLRPFRQQRQLPVRPGRPRLGVRFPTGEELGTGEIVEVDDERLGPVNQEARHGRRGGELVDVHVAFGRVVRVHPVLVGLRRQVVVNRLGENLRSPSGATQDVAQQERVCPGGVMRVERGHELMDGHRRTLGPGGAHRAGIGSGGGTVARTAVTR